MIRNAFTLVEVMVIIIIIGVMAAIAIPSFTKATRFGELNNSALNLENALNQANMRAKSTGQIHSVFLNSSVPTTVSVRRGDSCGSDVKVSGVTVYTDSLISTSVLQGRVQILASGVASSPTGTIFAPTTSNNRGGTWFSKSSGICARIDPKQTGNGVNKGWLTLGISGWNKLGVAVVKDSNDNRVQIWHLNETWSRIK